MRIVAVAARETSLGVRHRESERCGQIPGTWSPVIRTSQCFFQDAGVIEAFGPHGVVDLVAGIERQRFAA